jgi:hypothetical protein
MRVALWMIAIASSAGCLRDTEFKCTDHVDCTGTGGTCESTGYCSFTDSACADGRRYGAYAGSYSNQCVGGMADGGVDSGAGNCPSTFMTLPNAGGHVYKLTAGNAAWATQRDRCTNDGGYLAIPNDEAELIAITTAAAAARTWIGIHDQVTEGTYVTVKGETPTYLPWNTATGEPDNPGPMGGEDCVAALMATPTIATDRCSIDTYPAVCECEP